MTGRSCGLAIGVMLVMRNVTGQPGQRMRERMGRRRGAARALRWCEVRMLLNKCKREKLVTGGAARKVDEVNSDEEGVVVADGSSRSFLEPTSEGSRMARDHYLALSRNIIKLIDGKLQYSLERLLHLLHKSTFTSEWVLQPPTRTPCLSHASCKLDYIHTAIAYATNHGGSLHRQASGRGLTIVAPRARTQIKIVRALLPRACYPSGRCRSAWRSCTTIYSCQR